MGRVPVKAKLNPLIMDLFREKRSEVPLLGNRIFKVKTNGIKVTK
jgi:hypothetical protein